jgi:DNA-binding transcriptional regulator WhiA
MFFSSIFSLEIRKQYLGKIKDLTSMYNDFKITNKIVEIRGPNDMYVNFR